MKRLLLASAAVAALGCPVWAQSAIDMLQLTQPDTRGTARFMGMGGAFTALGGDLSTLTQNPAGIGIYRHSEIGVTVDLDIQKSSVGGVGNSKTQFNCNNFGYIGVANLNSSVAQTFAWGATYNRTSSFDRLTSAYAPTAATSLSNYIASYTTADEGVLNFGGDYNPYRDSDADWLSILAYSAYMINPKDGSTNRYNGLYQPGLTNSDAMLTVRERGYVDEYSINFGGNLSNTLYWGLGVGITDLSYRRDAYYSESMENARCVADGGATTITNGDAGFELGNYKKINGSGWKLSFGLIYKPINALRIGAAIHSPTWWSLSQEYDGTVSYSYFNPSQPQSSGNPLSGDDYTDFAGFDWKLKSPWRFMVGAAVVLGSNAIISVDYERQAYNDMTMKNAVYDNYGYIMGHEDNEAVNNDVRTYCRAANIVRVGAEYRVTPAFSIRAGYNVATSNIDARTRDGGVEVITSGTDPSYSFGKTNQSVSFGLGYRFGAFYLDGTYVYNRRTSDLHAYTNFTDNGVLAQAPSWEVTNTNNSIVLSLGFRF